MSLWWTERKPTIVNSIFCTILFSTGPRNLNMIWSQVMRKILCKSAEHSWVSCRESTSLEGMVVWSRSILLMRYCGVCIWISKTQLKLSNYNISTLELHNLIDLFISLFFCGQYTSVKNIYCLDGALTFLIKQYRIDDS